jgi:hypothetical protein
VFLTYGAPIILSGSATFAGYIKLDDDSTLLALTDRAMEHGRSLAGLQPSTYLRTLDVLLVHGYPLATFMPLGVGHLLVRVDALWLYQPCMAFMAALLALSLYALLTKLVGPGWVSAGIAFVAAQSALLYGYGLWGGMKELGTAWAVPLMAALVPRTVTAERPREVMPLAAVTALLLGVLNLGAVVWIAPALAVAFVLVWRERNVGVAFRHGAAFAGFLVLFALPTIVSARKFLRSNIVSFDPLANLIKPLSPLQLAGIWPTGDFRLDPSRPGVTHLLIGVALVAALAGIAWAVWRRVWELPTYAVGAVASSLVLYGASTPWIAGKAFSTASPAIPLAALAVAPVIARRGRPIEAAVLATVVAGGVLWSNVYQYHDAWLAPRGQLAELETIGTRFAGEGPALMTEYQPYGVRHLLRKLDPEGASELRFRQIPLRSGASLDKGYSANIDDFQLAAVLVYRTLVLRRSPVDSRPPSPYRLVWQGQWYAVWQRPRTGAQRILEHLPLGNDVEPGAMPSCSQVLRLARLAGPSGRLAAVRRPSVVYADLSRASYPSTWGLDSSGALVPGAPGTVEVPMDVPSSGRYGLWLGGSYRDLLRVELDGRQIASVRDHLEHQGQYVELASAQLAAGRHVVLLRYGAPDWRPGSGGVQFGMSSLVLSTTSADLPVTYVRPSDARTLCGRSLDWIEALAG